MGRMDRAGVATPEPLTQYWTKALEAAVAELTKKGITLQDTADDSMLVANLATELLSSRDKSGDAAALAHARHPGALAAGKGDSGCGLNG